MASQNPFDVGTGRRKTYQQTYGVSDPNQALSFTDTSPGLGNSPDGYDGSGVNPGGLYSNTQTGIPPATSSTTTTPTTQPSASWHTDQYSAPQYTAQNYGGVMSGWDAGKWGDANHQTPKYVVGRILSQFPATVDGLSQAMAQIQQAYPGATWNGKDKVNIPGVGEIDVLTGASQGGTGWAWQDPNAAAAAGTGTGTGGYGSGYGGAGFNDAIKQKLMALISQSNNPTDSPVYQGAVNAYNTQQQRGAEATRNAIAERMAASGMTNSGAMDAQLLGAEQNAAEAKASFAGDLGVRMLQQQRDEIMQALQMGANLMTEEQRLALQDKLGMINANLQQQGLGLQQQQITNQNNQFNSSLGWDQAQWEYLMNQAPWTA